MLDHVGQRLLGHPEQRRGDARRDPPFLPGNLDLYDQR